MTLQDREATLGAIMTSIDGLRSEIHDIIRHEVGEQIAVLRTHVISSEQLQAVTTEIQQIRDEVAEKFDILTTHVISSEQLQAITTEIQQARDDMAALKDDVRTLMRRQSSLKHKLDDVVAQSSLRTPYSALPGFRQPQLRANSISAYSYDIRPDYGPHASPKR